MVDAIYAIELLKIDGFPVPHRVSGDGGWFFSALSNAMYDCNSHSRRLLAEIVDVVDHTPCNKLEKIAHLQNE